MSNYSNNRVRHLRKKNNLTLAQLSNLVDIHLAKLSRIETGEQLIKIDSIITLSNYFEVSSDYLLGISDVASTHELKANLYKEISDRNKSKQSIISDLVYEKLEDHGLLSKSESISFSELKILEKIVDSVFDIASISISVWG